MDFSLKKMFSLARPPAGQVNGARRYIAGAANISINEDTAMTVSAFYRGVIYISTQIGKLPWKIKDIENRVQLGSVMNLLDLAPNDEMNAMTFRILMTQQALIHGNGYAEIQRNGAGTPIALWPIDSRAVQVVRLENGKLVYKINKGAANASGEDVYLYAEDMFHIKNFHTLDGLVGQGLVAYASQTLGISSAADKMASGIFSNGGMPSGVLSFEGKLSEDAEKRLLESWKLAHGGRKTGGTAVLEQGAKYTSISTDPELLQFLDSRKFGVVEIARFLGLPPTKLFDTQGTTYSNVENANLEVATDTLDAWAVNFEMEADVKLLRYRFGGRYSEIDLREIFRGDSKSRSEYYSKQMQNGAITPNEVRDHEGYAPYAEGNEFYIAMNNMTPAKKVNELIDAQIAAKSNPGTVDSPKAKEDTSANEADKKLKVAAANFLTTKT